MLRVGHQFVAGTAPLAFAWLPARSVSDCHQPWTTEPLINGSRWLRILPQHVKAAHMQGDARGSLTVRMDALAHTVTPGGAYPKPLKTVTKM